MAIPPSPARWALIGALVLALMGAAAPAGAGTGGWVVADRLTLDVAGYAPVLSPDGRWVAGIEDLDDRRICVWKVESGEQRCNDESSRVAETSIAWSPDSRQVAFSQNGHDLDSDVFTLDVENMALTNLTEDEVDDLRAAGTASRFVIYDQFPVWSADGEEILFLRILNPRDENGQRQIAVGRVVLATGQVLRGPELMTDEPLALVAEAIGVVLPPLWLPDGQAMLAIRGGQDITGVYVVDPAGSRMERIATEPDMPVAKTPLLTGATLDGTALTFYWLWEDIALGDDFHTYGWLDRESGDLAPFPIEVPRGMIVAAPPRFSPDGTAIVYGLTGDEQTHRDSTIVVQDLATGETTEIATGVSLQFWEGLSGIDWSEANQLVLPLDDGRFEIVTLDRA
jgi:Tol biopolymer transport system component